MPNPAVIKAAAALLSDERTRKGIGWIIAAILSPLIVLLALLCSLSAGSGHNASVVELCFNGGTLPPDTPAEYAAYIEDMRGSFGLLDGFIEDINGMTEEGKSLDGTRVKAIFSPCTSARTSPSQRITRCSRTASSLTRSGRAPSR